jgi:hypothetical protein
LWGVVLRLKGSLRLGIVLTALGVLACYAMWGYFLSDSPFATAEHTYGWIVAALFATVLALNLFSGVGYGLTAPFLEVTAESTPVGSWPVHLFAARRSPQAAPELMNESGNGARRTRLLAHSAAYDDFAVLRAIAKWMRASDGSVPGVAADAPAPDGLSSPLIV